MQEPYLCAYVPRGKRFAHMPQLQACGGMTFPSCCTCVCVQVYVTFDTNIGSAEVYNEGGVSVKRCIEVQERQGVPLPL